MIIRTQFEDIYGKVLLTGIANNVRRSEEVLEELAQKYEQLVEKGDICDECDGEGKVWEGANDDLVQVACECQKND